jgi:hypothetical protein
MSDETTKGRRIVTLRQLHIACLERRSVYQPDSRDFWNPKPASFVIHLKGATILNLINNGLFIYNKPKKEKK